MQQWWGAQGRCTGVVKVVDVDGADLVDIGQLLVLARPSLKCGQGTRTASSDVHIDGPGPDGGGGDGMEAGGDGGESWHSWVKS